MLICIAGGHLVSFYGKSPLMVSVMCYYVRLKRHLMNYKSYSRHEAPIRKAAQS